MTTSMTDDIWIEYFTVELRLRHVPGPAIGDAVASVRELLADSGQSAEEAFGSAGEYAASLELPTMNTRVRGIRTVLLPVLGLFTFLIFALASTARFDQDLVLVSVPQLLLLGIPVLLTVLFAFPFYPRAVIRQRWLPVVLMLVAGASGGFAAFLAPASAADAWLMGSALPLLFGAGTVLIMLSVVGTVATLRSRDDDEIIAPLHAPDDEERPRDWRQLRIAVNWLFPLMAVVVFTMAWVFSLLRP
ncbi:hypothetical protein [Salinibacterium sp. M195]|uniref:hypothetical protein n=1 Tax=Salinibacterium sp. M195 TaxID=2583374 RepID=UPI001C62E68C|nr:hypothetical protein [Salinibacterium sp. M195]QYH35288.1 hypothetical protein FFT87_04610 [Salinibacterium sp. M195]